MNTRDHDNSCTLLAIHHMSVHVHHNRELMSNDSELLPKAASSDKIASRTGFLHS